MCLIIPKDTPLLIAEEDILVKKMMYDNRRSCYMGVLYEKDKLYQAEIVAEVGVGGAAGTKSMCNWLEANYPKWCSGNDNLLYVSRGISSLAPEAVEESGWDYSFWLAFDAIIPKGSQYYTHRGVYVSNQIIVH